MGGVTRLVVVVSVLAGAVALTPALPARGQGEDQIAVSLVLSDLPLARQRAGASAASLAARQDEVVRRARTMAPGRVTELSRLSVLVNAVTLSVPRETASSLSGIEGVAAVLPERWYRPSQDIVPGQVRAPEAAQESSLLGNTFANAGKDVKIAIIDTGIDQTNPFLAPLTFTMPPGFPKGQLAFTHAKVIAAYDFCNPLLDPCGSFPQDDPTGHGTHVAGSAAGNYQTATGVPWNTVLNGEAPAARLGNYRVLGHAGGFGSSSEIAAGVEQAFVDGFDVLNLSLGGNGESNDIAGLAVEEAARQGRVVAVAAGNSGPRSYQIGQPASEPSVIVVGATTSNSTPPGGNLAGFSSPGPLRDESLKPDLGAPGTAVLSSVPGGFGIKSGTSMATPQVAGASALLKSAHPTWTAAQIKSALQTTGSPVTDTAGGRAPTWKVGGGQIDVLRATRAGAAATPSSLSFGKRNTAVQATYTKSIDVSLSALTTTVTTYTISVEPDPTQVNPGISHPISVSTGMTSTITLTVSAAQTDSRIRYSGTVTLTPGNSTSALRIPYLYTSINFPIPAGSVLYVDDSGADRAAADWDDPASSPPVRTPGSSIMYDDVAATGRTVRYWNRLHYGEPSLTDLLAARSVVWSFILTPAEDDLSMPNSSASNFGTLSGTELETMRAFLEAGGRLDVIGETFLRNVFLFAPSSLTNPEPNNFSTFTTFLVDRFGAAPGLPSSETALRGVTGDPVGSGTATSIGPGLYGGDRDSIILANAATKPTFILSPSNRVVGVRTAYGPRITAAGALSPERLGRTTFETFTTADTADAASGRAARDRILDYLEDDVTLGPSVTVTGGNVSLAAGAASSHGSVDRYVYDFGDGSDIMTTTEASMTHGYEVPGTYTIAVEAHDTRDNTAVATATAITFVPAGSTFYFAEGTVRPGFVEYLTLQNPGLIGTTALLEFQASNDLGAPVFVPSNVVSLPATSRVTVNVNHYLESRGVLTPLNVSVKVESDRLIVAERPVYFAADPALGLVVDGGTDVVGATSPGTVHSFAEGTVRPGFVEYLTLQNPGSTNGTATLLFQASNDAGGPVFVPATSVPINAGSRVTVNVNQYLQEEGVPVPINLSVRVESNVPIVAERPIYFSADPALGKVVDGGTDVVGARGLSTMFSFAEGTVRPGFVEYLTLQNPGPTDATVQIEFQASNDAGAPVIVPTLEGPVPAGGRVTVNINEELAAIGIPAPLNVSLKVQSDVPIVAERPIYFAADPALGRLVDGGTDVVGATSASSKWSFAEGTVRPGFVEYLTLQNPGSEGATATLAFQASNDFGALVAVPASTLSLPARSRVTVNVNEYLAAKGVPVPINISVKVTATKPIVAERPIYFAADPALGQVVDGGTDVVGLPR